jgi:hypothetical protein
LGEDCVGPRSFGVASENGRGILLGFCPALEVKVPTLIESQVAIPKEFAAFAEFIDKTR